MGTDWLKKRVELERMMGVDVLIREPGPEAELESISRRVSACTLCRLHQERAQAVFCRGNPRAELMFIGEGPGAEEDRQGLAFVGPAGKLLDKMVFAMGLTPDQVYIANIVKCRPPGNREPRADEVEACMPYLERQVDLVAPRVICTLGRPAANALLGTTESMGRMRGRWQSFRGVPVLPTYHPAYLLRSPSQKAKTWEDLKKVIAALREGPPETGGLF